MDQNEDILVRATERDPQTGLFTLNLTAQSVLDYTRRPLSDMIVQNKTVPINVTNPKDGTSWQVPGLLVLFTNPLDLYLDHIGLYIVDNTTGYEIRVNGPAGTPESSLPDYPPGAPDPRGDPIPIHGIGLDILPAVMDEPMKIINSISVTRR
jgi:hypothetical protein